MADRTCLALLVLAACVRMPHVAPEPRDADTAHRATVRVFVTCGENDPFDLTDGLGNPNPFPERIQWSPDREGTGVVISERHVLTAAHVVACPVIPRVTVTLADGRRRQMVVERDDAMFGAGADVARLELAAADGFGLGIAPPLIVTTDATSVVIPGLVSHPGDSGKGIYNAAGALLGLVSSSATDGSFTRIVTVGATWLEGT